MRGTYLRASDETKNAQTNSLLTSAAKINSSTRVICRGRIAKHRQGGNVAAKGSAVDLVDKDGEEGGGLVVWVRL